MFSYVTIPSIRKYIVFCHFCIPIKGMQKSGSDRRQLYNGIVPCVTPTVGGFNIVGNTSFWVSVP